MGERVGNGKWIGRPSRVGRWALMGEGSFVLLVLEVTISFISMTHAYCSRWKVLQMLVVSFKKHCYYSKVGQMFTQATLGTAAVSNVIAASVCSLEKACIASLGQPVRMYRRAQWLLLPSKWTCLASSCLVSP